MRWRGQLVICGFLTFVWIDSGFAQAPSPQQRRAELAKVQEMINDPDPLTRLVNMETIVEEGDALKVQIAIRTAMTSDDRDLRSLAMKAFIARLSEVTFAMSGDPKDVNDLQRASSDQARNEILHRRNNFLKHLDSAKFTQKFIFRKFDLKTGKGEVAREGYTTQAYHWRNVAVIGDRLVFTSETCIGGYNNCKCEVELRPTKDLKLVGTARCQLSDWPVINLSAEVN